jgi:peptidoglycan L-alanyl-D-glutamate endopeptidase CwlK
MSRLIEDLEPETQVKCAELLSKFPIFLTSTKRTHDEQHQLWCIGRFGDKRKKVTNAKAYQSWHETGRAFDIAFHDGKGGATWEGPWEEVAQYAKTLGLEWGGDWKKFPDKPHFQYTGGLTLLAAMLEEDRRNLV